MTAEPEAHLDSRYSWTRLAISILIATIGNVGMWAVVVVLPAVQEEFQVDRGLASIPFSFAMAGFAVGNMVLGRYVDRFGIGLPLLLAGAANGLGFVLPGLAGNIWPLALPHASLFGTGSAVTFAPLMADTSHWSGRGRGLAAAAAASGNYVAGAIWPVLLQPFHAEFGWRGT